MRMHAGVVVVAVAASLLGLTGAARTERPAAVSPAKRPATVKVAAVQCSSDLGAVEANREKLTALVEEAASSRREDHRPARDRDHRLPLAGPEDQLAPPRLADRPRVRQARTRSTSPRPFPGPSTDHFAALAEAARRLPHRPAPGSRSRSTRQATASRGTSTPSASSRPRARSSPTTASSRPGLTPSKSWATAGDRGVQVYDTEYGRVGLAICFDIHTILPKYQPHDIWALLYPIAWVDDDHPADWFWHRLPEQVATVRPLRHRRQLERRHARSRGSATGSRA